MISGLAALENDNPDMRDDFEAYVVYLIPVDPVARKKRKAYSNKRIGEAVSFGPKLNKGKVESGLEPCWHNNRAFHQISQPQKNKLVAWNDTADDMKSKEAYFSKLENLRRLTMTNATIAAIVQVERGT